MKKTILLFAILLPVFLNCKINEQKKMTLNVTSSEWYTTTSTFNDNKFCNVYLKVKGSSNAGLLSISTSGDGLAGCGEIKCNSDNLFSEDILICYFPIHDSTQRKFSTVLTAYYSRVKPNIVYCDAVGSGETITHNLESPALTCK
jgi:hypothetical protein